MNGSSIPLLVVVSAPSGGGKTTLCNGLLAAHPSLVRAITCTTRQPRPGEKDTVDYYFLSPAEFERRVAAGEFLEHAKVFGNRYGTLRSEVLDKLRQGRDVLLNIDVQGAASVRAQAAKEPELTRSLVSIFITPPSVSILEQRLRRRAQDSAEVIERRLAEARQEVAQWPQFDYLLISTSVEEDLRRGQTILAAESMKSFRMPSPEL